MNLMSSVDFSYQSDDDIFSNVIYMFKMSSEDFSHQEKMHKDGIFIDETKITSTPDAGEYLYFLTMLSTLVSSL